MAQLAVPFATLLVLAAPLRILRSRPFGRRLRCLGLVAGGLSLVMAALLMGPWATPLILIRVLAAYIELVRTRGRELIADASPSTPAQDYHAQIPAAR